MERAATGGALFAEVGNNFVPGNGRHLAGFQIVVTAVEHFARLYKLGNVPGHGVLNQLVRR
jgi:hypothetical protein